MPANYCHRNHSKQVLQTIIIREMIANNSEKLLSDNSLQTILKNCYQKINSFQTILTNYYQRGYP